MFGACLSVAEGLLTPQIAVGFTIAYVVDFAVCLMYLQFETLKSIVRGWRFGPSCNWTVSFEEFRRGEWKCKARITKPQA